MGYGGSILLVTHYSYIWVVLVMCYIVLKCYIIFLWEWVQLGFISVTLHFVTCDNRGTGVGVNSVLLLNVRGGL